MIDDGDLLDPVEGISGGDRLHGTLTPVKLGCIVLTYSKTSSESGKP